MTGPQLTPEQRRLATAGSELFVVACPGAGKTAALVERAFGLVTPLPPRHGIAVLSFTNAAVEEFKRRCQAHGDAHLLRYPTFVGTFDGFVRAFLFMPLAVTGEAVRPMVVESWRTWGVEARLRGRDAFPGQGVGLDLFDPATGHIDPSAIVHSKALRDHVTAHQTRYEDVARKRRSHLHGAGYFSSQDVRVKASERISDPNWGGPLAQSLRSRFREIIVDEAQDCNPEDLRILTWLREHKVRVTVVCDLDQAIYGFRRGNPRLLRAFAGHYSADSRHRLTGNFRSTEAITRLAATLRSRSQADEPLGGTASLQLPVLVALYPGSKPSPIIGRLFAKRLADHAVGLTSTDGIVLAHRWADARRAAGQPGVPASGGPGQSRVERLASAVGTFWSASAIPSGRHEPLLRVERIILELMGCCDRTEDCHPDRVIERNALDRRHVRRTALELLMHLPQTCAATDEGRRAWVERAREAVAALGLAPPEGKVAHFLRCPSTSRWAQHLRQTPGATLRCSSIHEAKGREYEAVCVVVQPDRSPDNRTTHLVEAWETRSESEGKRVLYVGVTRARRLVMLAIPERFGARCVAILERGRVPTKVIALEE